MLCKFCNKFCKNGNSLRNHERLCKINPDRQYTLFCSPEWIKNPDSPRSNQYLKAKKLGLPSPSLSLEAREKLSKAGKLKTHSEETKKKLSDNKIQYYKDNPDKIPYKLWHSSEESYPEKYFRELFDKDSVIFEQEYIVSMYSLDFAFLSSKIDFEVHGDSHYKPKCIEKDKRRKLYLESLGWKVIELKWSDYQKLDIEMKTMIVSELIDKVKHENRSRT